MPCLVMFRHRSLLFIRLTILVFFTDNNHLYAVDHRYSPFNRAARVWKGFFFGNSKRWDYAEA